MPKTRLTPAARARMTEELRRLVEQERPALARTIAGSAGPGDAADLALGVETMMEVERLDARIAALQLTLAEARDAPAEEEADTETVRPGLSVILRFTGDEQPERFLVGVIEEQLGGLPVITPESPLGRALLGARAGDVVEYRSPAGPQRTEVVAVGA